MARRPRSAKPRRSLAGRLVGWLVKAVFAFLILSILWVLIYRFVPPPITATMMGDLLGGRGVEKDWTPLERIDRDMVRAAIAGEDGKFCSHTGFDADAITQAMIRNARGGRIRGGSTISQQTAKNAFLWQGGGYFRKALEAWFTLLIENMWGKRRIMEVYLNIAETGIGTYGVEAGAQRYFDHGADAMTRTEAARIAAVLPLPKERGAVAPKGFTRRYGNSIAARIGVVARDGLDACVYEGVAAPRDTTPAATKRAEPRPKAKASTPAPLPGEEYEGEAAPIEAAPPEPVDPEPPAAEPVEDEPPALNGL